MSQGTVSDTQPPPAPTQPPPAPTQPPPAPTQPGTSKFAVCSLVAGLAIFVACGFLAYHAGKASFALIQRPLVDPQNPASVPVTTILENASGVSGAGLVIYNRVLEAAVYHPALAGKYAIVLCTLALSFGLLALGYGLFVLGVEGTVSLEAKRQANDQTGSTIGLAFSTQVPGAFCFLLGAILAIVAVSRSATLQLSPWEAQEADRSNVLAGPIKTPELGPSVPG